MKGETVNGTWLSGLWRKSDSDDNEAIGILAFEVAGLMAKLVSLWHSLSDREVMSLRQWIANSVGVRMLVSDDDYFLMELAINEILDSFESLARSVARLGKRCKNPVYHGYENFAQNPFKNYPHWVGWEYRWKKMDRKVRKMERFVNAMSQLSQEHEVLAEREQTFRRMKANPESSRGKLLEFQKKVMWQHEQVKVLRDTSPWNRSYDYIVRLLARSLFTILERISLVFGIGNSHVPIEKQQCDSLLNSNSHHAHNHSSPALMLSSVHPSETNPHGSSSELVWRKPVSNSEKSERKKKEKQVMIRSQSGKQNLHSESSHLKHSGSFKGCMPTNGGSMRLIDCHVKNIDDMKTVDKFSRRVYSRLSRKGRLKPGPCTLGDVALALHYANVVVLIEKIVSAQPHQIDLHIRDDLYNMLPTTIRTALKTKLKWYAKSKVHDAGLAEEWSLVLAQILEWLAPLAHNMVRWHSERNFEKEHDTLKANVLLVQTLYFANQAKTEAAMVELLVGLHYVCRIDREARIRDASDFKGVRLKKVVK